MPSSAGTKKSSKTWALSIPAVGTPRDTAQGPDRDIDGDGKANFIGGAPTGHDQFDTPFGGAKTGVEGFYLIGVGNEERFGSAVAIIGDTNGDQNPELIVGAPRAANATGTGLTWRIDVFDSGGRLLKRLYGPDNLPTHDDIVLAPAGDINGDSFADLAYGDSTADGRVSLIMGSASGLDYDHFTTLDGPADQGE